MRYLLFPKWCSSKKRGVRTSGFEVRGSSGDDVHGAVFQRRVAAPSPFLFDRFGARRLAQTLALWCLRSREARGFCKGPAMTRQKFPSGNVDPKNQGVHQPRPADPKLKKSRKTGGPSYPPDSSQQPRI